MRKKKRGSSRYFVLFIMISLLISLFFLSLKTIVSKVNWFEIKKIEISGNINLDHDYLINLSKEFIGQNLFSVSRNNVLLKYENIIRVKDISLRKIPFHTLKIIIKERVGFFYIKSCEGLLFPIDKERVVLDNDVFYESEVLPVINTEIPAKNLFYGEAVNDKFVERIFDFYSQINEYDNNFFSKISEFCIQNNDICITETENSYRVIFGNDNLKEQLARFNFIEANRNFVKNTTVDLRFVNQLIIRTEEH